MKLMNLPKNWGVLNDDSNDFKKVIKYINDNSNCTYNGKNKDKRN